MINVLLFLVKNKKLKFEKKRQYLPANSILPEANNAEQYLKQNQRCGIFKTFPAHEFGQSGVKRALYCSLCLLFYQLAEPRSRSTVNV